MEVDIMRPLLSVITVSVELPLVAVVTVVPDSVVYSYVTGSFVALNGGGIL